MDLSRLPPPAGMRPAIVGGCAGIGTRRVEASLAAGMQVVKLDFAVSNARAPGLIDVNLSSRFCHEAEQAAHTGVTLVHGLADTSNLLFTGHFPSPTAGRIISKSDHFRFETD